MKARLTLILIAIGLGFAPGLRAQLDPLQTQYFLNKSLFNPGYLGSTGQLSARMSARWQWVGMENAPRTQTLSAHMPTPDERHGVGMNLQLDQYGHSSRFMLNFGYAYRIPMAGGHLGMGLDLGLRQFGLNLAGVDIPGPDPMLPNNRASTVLLMVGPGFYFQNQYAYAGISMPNILPTPISKLHGFFISTDKQPRTLYVMAGGAIPLGGSVKLRPSVLLRYSNPQQRLLDLGIGAMFIDRFMAGAIWRPGNSLAFHAQAYITERLQLGYSYDLMTNTLKSFNSGGHELILGVDLNVHKSSQDEPIRF
ncbi:MAG: type IX secretion system membrane protein PorP/SprF [Bacteroidia bacterium]